MFRSPTGSRGGGPRRARVRVDLYRPCPIVLYHDTTTYQEIDSSPMSKRVLLIDYEPRSVERLQGLLSPEYELVLAKDGEEGLATFGSAPRFDAVIVAGMLPRLASGEVIREIRRKGGATA